MPGDVCLSYVQEKPTAKYSNTVLFHSSAADNCVQASTTEPISGASAPEPCQVGQVT
jgi:hypothetical protein